MMTLSYRSLELLACTGSTVQNLRRNTYTVGVPFENLHGMGGREIGFTVSSAIARGRVEVDAREVRGECKEQRTGGYLSLKLLPSIRVK